MSVQATHAHHFMIESPDKGKAFLAGVCKHCPEERLFPNGAIDYNFVGQKDRHEYGWHNQSDRHFDGYTGRWAS